MSTCIGFGQCRVLAYINVCLKKNFECIFVFTSTFVYKILQFFQHFYQCKRFASLPFCKALNTNPRYEHHILLLS